LNHSENTAVLTQNDLQVLEQAGRFEESRAAALEGLKSSKDSERIAGAIFLIANMKFDLMGEALAALKPLQAQLEGDFNACNVLAYAAWYRDDVELSRWASHRCIGLAPAASAGYLRLGLLELMKQRYVEAYCAFSAGLLHCPKEIELFQAWYKLSKVLSQGINNVEFVWDGIKFSFRLATYNGHAMETACQHVLGRFCEEEELRYVRQFVGRCDSIVEVGAAVGNHTIFFAKVLSPKSIHVFEAYCPAVEQIKDNTSLNCDVSGGQKITVHHAAVGAKPGRMRIFDQDVSVVRLDDEVKVHVDFIKIDVDGMEMEVLEGCRGLFARDRPKIMVEVQNELKERFHAFIREYDYVIEREAFRATDTNYYIRPKNLPA